MWKVNRVLGKYLGDGHSEGGDIKIAAANIHSLLSAIDPEAEVIPENNEDMLSRLITSLKGEELNEAERMIIREITK